MGERLVTLEWEQPGVAVLTITREKAMNALDAEVLAQLEGHLDAIEREAQARVAIVTGQGERAFVAGADIAAIQAVADEAQARAFAERGQQLFQRFEQSRVIFIAGINGYALGGGLELAMAMDFRIAATSARLGQPEINLGIIPGFGGTQRLTRLVGVGRALWLIASGRPVTAEEGRAMGLVEMVVEPQGLLTECLTLARELAQKAPLALAETKRLVRSSRDWPLGVGLDEEARAFAALAISEDGREGTRAFLQKRAPVFRGR